MFDNKLSLYFLFLFAITSFNYWPIWAKDLAFNYTDIQVKAIHSLGYADDISDKVVVVEIDDETIDQFGRWPWSRVQVGELFTKLDTASVVVADMVFSERASDHEDQVLAEAISDADNVILGFFLRGKVKAKADYSGYADVEKCAIQNVRTTSSIGYVGLPSIKGAEVNIPLIADAAMSCALFSVVSEYDGLYRKYPLAYIFQDLVVPTLAVQAFQFDTNEELSMILDENGVQRLTGRGLSVLNQNSLYINFPKKINALSAADLLNDKIEPNALDGKVVLVGLSEIGLFDLRPTPLDTYTPGVHLHAAALSNLIDKNWYQEDMVIGWFVTLFSLILIIQLSKLSTRASLRWFLYTLAIGSILFVSTYFLAKLKLQIGGFQTLIYLMLCIFVIEALKFLDVQKKYVSVREAFSSYVVPELVEKIVEQGVDTQQNGQIKPVSVVFTDIRDFTSLSESIAPEDVIKLLNTVFDPITEIISNHQGMLDKYIGDEVMAVFNAPMDVEHYKEKSVDAAISMQKSLSEINYKLAEAKLPNVELSIGIAAGPVILGNVGSSIRVSYTAIGNTVNLAARITSLSKLYHQQILICHNVYQDLTDDKKKQFSFVDEIIVKGRSESEKIFGVQNVELSYNEVLNESYMRAYANYKRGEFDVALDAFGKVYKQYQHKLSKTMASRCKDFIAHPPNDWNGVYKFDHK